MSAINSILENLFFGGYETTRLEWSMRFVGYIVDVFDVKLLVDRNIRKMSCLEGGRQVT